MKNSKEQIEILEAPPTIGSSWSPIIGPETVDLLNYFRREKHLDEEGCSILQGEALNILSKCTSPQVPANPVTGIAIGYVQSGKTMSYTTVAALARDNGYRMLIVITGISVPLLGQGSGRLRDDLRLLSRTDHRWQPFENPTVDDKTNLENTLADWDDAVAAGSEPQMVLITVMKNASHLQNLVNLLSSLRLGNVPTLIIDDEADQASLNTRARRGGESPTYKKLLYLRNALPHHSFLQYTATPQAPLLINIIDVLSPKFVEVLTPGKNYTGGKHFFILRPELVKAIPSSEIPSDENPLSGPPDTLREALQIFFLGVAAGLPRNEARNRSMLVHPSRETIGHGQYFGWVTDIVNAWRRILSLTDGDPDKIELLDSFEETYKQLQSTISTPLPFDELKVQLLRALRQTQVIEMNASGGQTPHINWSRAYPYILVGGQAMDRGFTIEGLTVTYMPRGTGVGNADTIQQRARFFGYKLGYLGYCRVYLDAEVESAFRSYVDHEEDIRERLLEYNASGKPLRDWKRAFFLDPNLKPTRKNVLALEYLQDTFSDSWYDPKTPHDPEEAVQNNRSVVNKFINSLKFVDDIGDPKRTQEQKHKVADGVPLKVAYEELLVKMTTMPPDDSQKFTGLLLQVEQYLEGHPDATCSIYQMSGGSFRERGVNGDNEITQLFQGKNERTGYPGDREIRGQGLTIQIHRLNITSSVAGGQIASDVPTVAIWIPSEMAQGWLVQDER